MEKTCLIIDDVEVSQYVIGTMMEDLGFKVMNAGTASEAMGKLDASPFTVILLDWHLRKASGLEMVPHIRNHVNGGRTPILVCTGVELDKELADIKSSDIQGLLKKPTSRENLEQELRRLQLL